MPLFLNILMLLLITAIVLLHIGCALARRRRASLNILALFAHIAALVPLLYFSLPLEAVAALYMASVAVRSVAFTVSDLPHRRRGDSGEVEK